MPEAPAPAPVLPSRRARPRGRRWRARVTGVGSAVIAAGMSVALAACGGTQGGGAQSGSTDALTINVNGGGPFVCNYNPYSPNQTDGSAGFIYEPMMIVNTLNGSVRPWLATSYAWSSGNRVLTFTIRKGVTFSNGEPFSATDVAFSFNLLKKFAGLDLNAVWSDSGLSSVTAPSPTKVVFTFARPDTPLFFYIAQTAIVPEKVWSKVANPVSFANTKPVGTGPYELASCQSSEYQFKANPHYWQPGKPTAKTITVPSLPSGAIADTKLSQGVFDWGGLFAPNVQGTYVAKDPKYNHYWYPQGTPVIMYPNDKVYPMNIAGFRRAMALALDRSKIGKIGESGYEDAANQTGVTLPEEQQWYDASAGNLGYDPGAAAKLLSSLGFTKKSGKLVAPNGQAVSLTIQVPSGFIDWISDCQLIAQELGAVGISVRVITPSYSTWQSNLATGHFTLALDEPSAGSNPWFMYHQVLATSETAAEGKTASSNYERWGDPATDKLLASFSSTSSVPAQKSALAGIEKIMVQQAPVIPLVYQAWWEQYSTQHFTGWPSAADPYAVPSPYSYPDDLLVITSIRPVR
jgi:peptide/nickel transport system substrate-binding protein